MTLLMCFERLAPLRPIAVLAAIAFGLGADPARATSPDLQRLRDYYAGRGDSAELRRRLTKLSIARLLRLLRDVEPHVRQPKEMQRFETDDGAYYVIPPHGYSPRKAWPVHIALHGHGATQTGRVACTHYWKGEPARSGVLLVCPDLRGKWNTARGERLLFATYKDVQQRFNVRTDHVSLGGFSGGGIGAWLYGPRYPDLFSALVPRAGIPPRAEEVIRNLNGLPVFLVHGRGDGTIPVEHSRRVARTMQELKIEHVYRELVGGHEFMSGLNEEVLQWVKRRTRRFSTSFRYFGPAGGPPRIIHWLQLTGSGDVTVRGQIVKRRRVVIELDHPERIRELTVHLSRKVFDMHRRSVDVVVNGRSFGFPVRERASSVLDSYGITRDLRRVFTAEVTLTRKHLSRVGTR